MVKRILSIQSHVTAGRVGNATASFVLQRAGFETIAVPTVLFSNHPGHGHYAGHSISDDDLDAILNGLASNKWFGKIDAILTGYIGAATQAEIIAPHIASLKQTNPDLIYCCDPVCGDEETGLYVSADVAAAIHSHLLPLADLATPNRFELDHLMKKEPGDDYRQRTRDFPCPVTLCTSVPFGTDRIGEILSTPQDLLTADKPFLKNVPKGTGDLYTALFLANTLRLGTLEAALAATSDTVHAILKQNMGTPELDLISPQHLFD